MPSFSIDSSALCYFRGKEIAHRNGYELFPSLIASSPSRVLAFFVFFSEVVEKCRRIERTTDSLQTLLLGKYFSSFVPPSKFLNRKSKKRKEGVGGCSDFINLGGAQVDAFRLSIINSATRHHTHKKGKEAPLFLFLKFTSMHAISEAKRGKREESENTTVRCSGITSFFFLSCFRFMFYHVVTDV